MRLVIFPVPKFDAFKLPESRGVSRALFEGGGGGGGGRRGEYSFSWVSCDVTNFSGGQL